MTTTIARSPGPAVRTAFGVLALCCTALPALAAEADFPKHAVHYSDLDVSHEAGAAVLYRRIAAAADKVCSNLERVDLSSQQRFKGCVNKAIEDAVTAVNQPALSALHQGKRSASRLSVASAGSR